jgi:hypothetical protein
MDVVPSSSPIKSPEPPLGQQNQANRQGCAKDHQSQQHRTSTAFHLKMTGYPAYLVILARCVVFAPVGNGPLERPFIGFFTLSVACSLKEGVSVERVKPSRLDTRGCNS